MLFSAGRVAGVAFLCCIATGQTSAADSLNLPGYQGVQMTRGSQNHLLMSATINGHPATLLVDTGSDTSFLQADRAQAFGMRALGEETRRNGQNFALAPVNDLRAGNTSLGSSTFALYQASQLSGPVPGAGGKSADGLLGLDLLTRHKAVINCHTRQLFFKTDPNIRLDLASITKGLGFVQIGMEQNRNSAIISVPCKIRGRAGRLQVDTGAFLSGLDDEAVRSLGLQTTPSALTSRGLDGKIRPIDLAQVDDLTIGGLPIAPQKLVSMDVFARKKARRTYTAFNKIEYYMRRDISRPQPIFGLLGNELLDQRRAIIDLDRMALFLK